MFTVVKADRKHKVFDANGDFMILMCARTVFPILRPRTRFCLIFADGT